MNTVWVARRKRVEGRERWVARRLPAGGRVAGSELGLPAELSFVAYSDPSSQTRRSRTALVLSPGVSGRVNGAPLAGGGLLRVLEHRDEVSVEGTRVFYSEEVVPVVERFVLGSPARRPRCPVCRDEIQEGEESVRCRCNRVYHQIPPRGDDPGRPCYTHRDRCVYCHNPTRLDGRDTWTPEEAQDDG